MVKVLELSVPEQHEIKLCEILNRTLLGAFRLLEPVFCLFHSCVRIQGKAGFMYCAKAYVFIFFNNTYLKAFVPCQLSTIKSPQQLCGNVIKWVPDHVDEFQFGF